MRFAVLLVCVALVVLLSGVEAKRRQRVTYTVENFLPNTTCEEWFSHTVVIEFGKGKTFERVMVKAANVNQNFHYNSTDDSAHGLFITCINHLCQSHDEGFYWGIVHRYNDGYQCLLPYGPGRYQPENGQHIAWSYFTLAMFSEIPSCTGDAGHD